MKVAYLTCMSTRVQDMTDLYRSGQTLEEIGQKYGFTREYIRQILKREGLTRADGGVAVRVKTSKIYRAQINNTYYENRWGHDKAAHLKLRQLGHTGPYARSPIGAFQTQRNNARHRNIDWKLTLAEWWNIWEQSGKWRLRGRGHEGYVMSRYGDTGAYESGNVFIQSADDNCSNKPTKTHDYPMGVQPQINTRTGKVYGWTASKMLNGVSRYLGTFRTPEDAQQAYTQAS